MGETFAVLSQFGLILLLFVVGLEFDFSHLRGHGRSALAISLSGIAVPLLLGMGLAIFAHRYIEPSYLGTPVPRLGFILFMGVAMLATAIPVLGRVMMELNITRTRLGAVTISAVAVDDACGWILLATISSIVRAQFDPWASLGMIAATGAFTALMLLVVRPLMRAYVRWALRRDGGDLSPTSLAVVLVVMFLAALATSKIGIFAIFGAFLLGTVLSDEIEFREVFARHMRDFLTVFVLPIFFTYTGLRTNIGALDTAMHWALLLGVLTCAVAGKLGGCWVAARAGGFPPHDAACICALLNARGLMGLVVANVRPRSGHDSRQRLLHAHPDGPGDHRDDHAAGLALHAFDGIGAVHSPERLWSAVIYYRFQFLSVAERPLMTAVKAVINYRTQKLMPAATRGVSRARADSRARTPADRRSRQTRGTDCRRRSCCTRRRRTCP